MICILWVQDDVVRGKRRHPMFAKVAKAGDFRAIVLPCQPGSPPQVLTDLQAPME